MSGILEQLNFSNSNIDLACEDVGGFLISVGVERREVLRIKLTLEEILLEYRDRFGEDACFRVRCLHVANMRHRSTATCSVY